jgi:hypothetical protein
LQCIYCHAGALKAELAGFPAADVCLTCHKRDGDGRAGIPGSVIDRIPSRRVYKLPDFVFFSHATHGAAKITCDGCHGKVYEMETVRMERPIYMRACIGCHKENKAAVTCTTCHELGQ